MRTGLISALLVIAACTSSEPTQRGASSTASASASTAGPSASAAPAPAPSAPRTYGVREGQALMRSPSEAALYLADEDGSALRRIPLTKALSEPPPLSLPLDDHQAPPLAEVAAGETVVALPGRPAQVFPLAERVLLTVRQPSALLIYSAGEKPALQATVELPEDAWGLAVSHDGKSAFVSSAWSHQVSRIDLESAKLVWSVEVAREPRGLTVTEDGTALYVSHLIGSELTKIELPAGTQTPTVKRVPLPADPLRTFAGDKTIRASLGYALLLAPDGQRLFAARQALGTFWGWQGNPTVDGLIVASDEPLAPARDRKSFGQLTKADLETAGAWDSVGAFADSSSPSSWVQPRAMVYRRKTQQLLVASEGTSNLVELDAMSVSPGVLENRIYRLGGLLPKEPNAMKLPPHCGAPSAVALSAEEDVAWVYCRTTDEIAAVRLTPTGERGYRSETTFLDRTEWKDKISPWGPFVYAKLESKPLDAEFALGRRLYFDATEPTVSGDMACAGCHPDGREDGHVWREAKKKRLSDRFAHFFAGPTLSAPLTPNTEPEPLGFPRQTVMLAGRVSSPGPYGWHAESATLVDRIKAGFQLHRVGDLITDGGMLRMRAEPLAKFLREGLVAPPKLTRALTEEETRGKALFESEKTQCAVCHVPATEFSNRSFAALASKTQPLFDDEADPSFKVPPLTFVGGTPPYFHDASAPTLEYLIEKNGDRMGKTSHLKPEQRQALVAYLRTL
jgi:DNA-binding beta-propeller fold protein YncE